MSTNKLASVFYIQVWCHIIDSLIEAITVLCDIWTVYAADISTAFLAGLHFWMVSRHLKMTDI